MGREVTLVTGPPCAGKTTFVKAHCITGGRVFDLDAMRGEGVLHPGVAMRRGVSELRHMSRGQGWYVRCVAGGVQRHALALHLRATRVVLLLPPLDVLHARAMTRPDPRATLTAIGHWLRAFVPHQGDEVLGGIGTGSSDDCNTNTAIEW